MPLLATSSSFPSSSSTTAHLGNLFNFNLGHNPTNKIDVSPSPQQQQQQKYHSLNPPPPKIFFRTKTII